MNFLPTKIKLSEAQKKVINFLREDIERRIILFIPMNPKLKVQAFYTRPKGLNSISIATLETLRDKGFIKDDGNKKKIDEIHYKLTTLGETYKID